MSETQKYRRLTVPYCIGDGLDVGSQGDPVVPWAISLDLPDAEYKHYSNSIRRPDNIELQGDLRNLPFKDETLDFVYCSHVIEDFPRTEWPTIFREFARVVKPGGYIVILVPENQRWNYAVKQLGQPPNCSHSKPEPELGDMTAAAKEVNLKIIKEEFTEQDPYDYSLIGVFQK